MTDFEERARQILAGCEHLVAVLETPGSFTSPMKAEVRFDRDAAVSAIASALKEAVEAENEACAVMLEGCASRIKNTDAISDMAKKNLNTAAEAIRLRSAIRSRLCEAEKARKGKNDE